MPQFAGRKEQLERLDILFQDVAQGRGNTLFLFGESGTGKYALIRHFTRAHGIPLFSHTYRHRERKQFVSLLAIMTQMKKSGLTTPELEKALDYFSQDNSGAKGPKDRDNFFKDIVKGILSGDSKPIVIMLDNMHWADGETISILPALSRAVKSKKILLAASYVSEAIAERDGGTHPLMEAMGDMMMEDLFQAMEMGPLSPQETEEMIAGIVESKPPKALVFAVFSASKGNPLFVKEMMEDMLKKGIIDPSDPAWASKVKMDKISLPSSLKDATKSTITQLEDSEKALLELMSIMASDFNEVYAQNILGMSESEVFDTLLQLIEKKLVDEESGKYMLHHSFIAGSVLENMKRERRKDLHQKVFHALKSKTDLLTLGHHAMEAEMWEPAAEALLDAAKKAKKEYAFISGKEAARMAMESAVKASRADIATKASLLYGIMAYDMGDWNEAYPLLMQASKAGGAPAGEALLYMAHLERNKSHWAESIAFYSQALEMLDPKSILAADALRGIGKVSWRQGKQDDALHHIKKAVELAQELGDIGMTGSTCIDMGNVYHSMGKHAESIASHTKAIETLTPLEAWGEIARAYNNMGEVYKENGDLSTAVKHYERAIEIGEKSGDKRIRAYAMGNAAECNARLGETAKAKPMADEATEFFKAIGENFVIASMQMTYGIIASKEGDWEEAWKRFEEGASSLELMGIKYDYAIIMLEYCRALKAKGDPESLKKAREVLLNAKEAALSIEATSLIIAMEKEEAE